MSSESEVRPTVYLAGPVMSMDDGGAGWREDVEAYCGEALETRNPLSKYNIPVGDLQVVDSANHGGDNTVSVEEIDVALPIASPRMYVARYVNDLDGEARTETVAREVAAAADEAGLTANGAAPSAVAAGCVYEAFVAAQWEAKHSQPEVGEVAGVSDPTVRRHWQRLQEAGIDGGQVDV